MPHSWRRRRKGIKIGPIGLRSSICLSVHVSQGGGGGVSEAVIIFSLYF